MLNARIRKQWDKVMRPVGRSLGRLRIHPNAVTALGVALQAWAAYLILEGALVAAGLVTAAAGVADVLDGAVAKARGMAGRFGALLDSTTDRLADALVFLPLVWLYAVTPDLPERDEPWVAVAAMVTLVASILVSYVKARAESLGFDCNVGIAERAERIMIVVIGLVFDLIPLMLVVLGTLSIVTFIQRVVHVYRQDRADRA